MYILISFVLRYYKDKGDLVQRKYHIRGIFIPYLSEPEENEEKNNSHKGEFWDSSCNLRAKINGAFLKASFSY